MSNLNVTIHLKSGDAIRMPMEQITTKRNSLTGELTGMDWTYAEDDPMQARVQYIDLSQVAAVTTWKTESDTEDKP